MLLLSDEWSLVIDRVCVLKGRGTVATGRVEQGTIKVGEEVEVLGLTQVDVQNHHFLRAVMDFLLVNNL